MEIAEEVLAEQSLKVDIISCTDYHAIFGVYYVMGMSLKEIKSRYSDSHRFFGINPFIDEEVKSETWMKSSI
jgi:ABC-type polysaccharide/polyol phosphate transport system ATPase subunit